MQGRRAITLPEGEQALWFDLQPPGGAWRQEHVLHWLEAAQVRHTVPLPVELMCLICDAAGRVREYACDVAFEIVDGPQPDGDTDAGVQLTVEMAALAHGVDLWSAEASERWLKQSTARLGTHALQDGNAEA